MSTCPRDGTPLAVTKDVFGPGLHAQTCPRCSGVLVEWKVAQKFFESLGLTLADLQVAVQKASPIPRTTPPPGCTSCGKGAMKPFRVKGVELDLCESCGAAWFDRGELARITGGKLGAKLPTAPQPVAGVNERVVGVFQMFWDCAYCDTKALLGQTHRCCPKCGAAQDPNRRYFPPAGQEVAANTEYDGADNVCPACQTPNGAKAVHCRQCGSPMDGSAKVNLVADRVSGPPQPVGGQAVAGQKKSKLWLYVIGAVAVLMCGFCGVAALWTKDGTATVSGHHWTREIDVEVMRPRSDSSWCDSTPSDAYGVSRKREQRSTKQIPDGETCSTRDVDRGNGTFERRKECHPKYREEPIYDDRCYYSVNRWQQDRTLRNQGQGLDSTPTWPAVSLGRTGTSVGSEREGPRREKYVVELRGPKGEDWSCETGAAKWQSLPKGTSRTMKIGVITNSPHCDTL